MAIDFLMIIVHFLSMLQKFCRFSFVTPTPTLGMNTRTSKLSLTLSGIFVDCLLIEDINIYDCFGFEAAYLFDLTLSLDKVP
jgi:hypothetical protein